MVAGREPAGLADAVKTAQPVVVFASTVTVIRLPKRSPVAEDHPEDPLTIYDLHKLMADQYLFYSGRQGFDRGTVLRLSNVYDPGPLRSFIADPRAFRTATGWQARVGLPAGVDLTIDH